MNELTRLVALDRIGGAGFEIVVDARPEELEALARRLLIPAVNRLQCAFTLRRVAEGVIEAQGLLEAEVVQTCIVSAEPVTQPVSESFEVQFVPAGTEAPDDDLEAPDQIPYGGHALDVGEAAAEQLALALDPYPRKPGEEESAPEAEAEPSPFAALSRLRDPQ
jgi:uncharacterized metal-binding protein YceD (DUF177 family)